MEFFKKHIWNFIRRGLIFGGLQYVNGPVTKLGFMSEGHFDNPSVNKKWKSDNLGELHFLKYWSDSIFLWFEKINYILSH